MVDPDRTRNSLKWLAVAAGGVVIGVAAWKLLHKQKPYHLSDEEFILTEAEAIEHLNEEIARIGRKLRDEEPLGEHETKSELRHLLHECIESLEYFQQGRSLKRRMAGCEVAQTLHDMEAILQQQPTGPTSGGDDC